MVCCYQGYPVIQISILENPPINSAYEFNSVQHFTRIYLRSKIAHLLHKQVLQSQNLNTAAILSRPSPSFYRSAAHSHLDPVKSLD